MPHIIITNICIINAKNPLLKKLLSLLVAGRIHNEKEMIHLPPPPPPRRWLPNPDNLNRLAGSELRAPTSDRDDMSSNPQRGSTWCAWWKPLGSGLLHW
jgi:hypothetical protein